MEDNFSKNGGGGWVGGDGSGSNASGGEQQMKLHSLARSSPSAVWPVPGGCGPLD